MIDRDDVLAAAQRIAPHVRRTPTFRLDGIVVKLEQLQHTGSFKVRGASNFVLSQAELPTAGLIAASGGNHALAVAYVGRQLGLPVEVFVPELSPEAKRRRIAELGATVVVAGAVYDDAQAACRERAAETGALLVHPFDSPAIMAGAGTTAMEVHRDEPAIDTLLVAVGGGGLVAGSAAWCQDDVQVVAVEPVTASCLHAALDAGRPVDTTVAGIAADSLGARQVGRSAFDLAVRHRVRSLTVTDADIIAAQRQLWERARIVAEPGGAAAFAALTSGAHRPAQGEQVAVIVCGGNVDPATLTGAA